MPAGVGGANHEENAREGPKLLVYLSKQEVKLELNLVRHSCIGKKWDDVVRRKIEGRYKCSKGLSPEPRLHKCSSE